jgi:hypothetical protein
MIVETPQTWKKTLLDNLATWCMMIALFFNPFGFDIVQYQLVKLTGSLWGANFVLYCIAGLFFILSMLFRWYSKTAKK